MSDYRYLSADIVSQFFSSEKNPPIKHVTLHNAWHTRPPNVNMADSSSNEENAAAAVET